VVAGILEKNYLRLGREPGLQINGPINNTTKVQALRPIRTLLLRRRSHIRNPISHTLTLCSKRHDIRVRILIIPSLRRDTLLALLSIIRDETNLSVGEVSGFTGADTRFGFRDAEASGELTCWACALGVFHSEAAAVAGDTDDDLGGVDAGFGDHCEGVESFGLVDVGAETVAVGAAGADELVTVVCNRLV
jgi:hypothetical protein